MNLYFLRHASAGTSRTNPTLDQRRPLDKDGKQHCLHLAHLLNALKVTFDLVISSPLKRAVQTAQLVATETGYEAGILQTGALAPAAGFAEFRAMLEQGSRSGTAPNLPRENILLVGHNPNLSFFLGSMLGGTLVQPTDADTAARPAAQVRLRKGSLARVSFTNSAGGAATMRGAGTLTTLLDPRMVRALYKTSTASSRRMISRK